MRKLFSIIVLIILSIIIFVDGIYADASKRTFKDFLNREVTIDYPPKKIISLAPNVTEILFAIGLDKEIVGVTKHCDYPPQKVKKIKKIGDFWNPSIELITRLKPDIVVTPAAGHNKPTIDKLTGLGIKCFVVNPEKINQILKTMDALSDLTGKQKIGKKKVNELKERVKRIDEKVKNILIERREKVFYALDERNLWTAGEGAFIDDLIKSAGGVNISDDRKGWYKYEPEKLVVDAPDVILTGISKRQKKEEVIDMWKDKSYLSAVKNNRICLVDENSLSRAGPRSIDVLEKLFKFLYGEEY